MKTWDLIRLADGPDGTLALLETEPGPRLFALEEEAQQNRVRVSRIPAGEYVCERTMYHKGGYETFEVTSVPGRSRILFHPANTEEGLEGCIAPGFAVGTLRVEDEDSHKQRRKLAVLDSKNAFERFMEANRGAQTFRLRVFDPGTAV